MSQQMRRFDSNFTEHEFQLLTEVARYRGESRGAVLRGLVRALGACYSVAHAPEAPPLLQTREQRARAEVFAIAKFLAEAPGGDDETGWQTLKHVSARWRANASLFKCIHALNWKQIFTHKQTPLQNAAAIRREAERLCGIEAISKLWPQPEAKTSVQEP